MRDSKLVALKLLVWLALIGHINGCEPQSPPVERDVMRKLLTSFVLPMGDLSIVSRPSDCRTDGQTVWRYRWGFSMHFLTRMTNNRTILTCQNLETE